MKVKRKKNIHHILPKHDGGTDDKENLIEISQEEHAELHLKRYFEKKSYRDLRAYNLLMSDKKKRTFGSFSYGDQINEKVFLYNLPFFENNNFLSYFLQTLLLCSSENIILYSVSKNYKEALMTILEVKKSTLYNYLSYCLDKNIYVSITLKGNTYYVINPYYATRTKNITSFLFNLFSHNLLFLDSINTLTRKRLLDVYGINVEKMIEDLKTNP